ncbi:MAG: sulfatase-like hydrolase/transferase [Kofleriaceae bacterium]
MRSIARWLAPSIVAAAIGALGCGVIEGFDAGPLPLALTAGYVALIVVPLLFAMSVLARALAAAWRVGGSWQIDDPAELAGWVATLCMSVIALAWTGNAATWWLASVTEFKAAPIGFGQAGIAVAVTLLLVAASRPSARLFAAIARRIDARWRRSGRATLLRPTPIFVAAGVVMTVIGYVTWLVAVRPRLGPIDTSALNAPAIGVAIALVVHAAWSKLRHVAIAAGAIAIVLATTATALITKAYSPAVTLEVWGDRPIAGLAIDALYDLDAIRSAVSLERFRPAPRPGAPHPDIILITIDTMRADRLVAYGGTAPMPTLESLANRGTVFEFAYAPSNVTRRSIPSMVIGFAPTRIKGRVVNWALRVDPRYVLLAERLRAGGYDTAGFMCCDRLWGPEVRSGWERGLDHVVFESNGAKLARMAGDWLAARERLPNRRPVFLWMHVLEPHNWTVGISATARAETPGRFYDAALSKCDPMLAEILKPFEVREPANAPIVIVTADHGEGLGDHGNPNHATDLYNSQLRVPLIVQGPGIGQQRVPETVSLIDLTPTIVELAGFIPPVPPDVDGTSFAALATGAKPAVAAAGTAFAAMIKDRSSPREMFAMIRGRWKLIQTGDVFELYDVQDDPNELSNLAARHPQIVGELRALLDEKRAAAAVSPLD